METVDSDIALLMLSRPAKKASKTRYVCVPNAAMDDHFPEGTSCYLLGWGKMQESHATGTHALREATVPIVERQKVKLFLVSIAYIHVLITWRFYIYIANWYRFHINNYSNFILFYFVLMEVKCSWSTLYFKKWHTWYYHYRHHRCPYHHHHEWHQRLRLLSSVLSSPEMRQNFKIIVQ